MPIYYGLVLIEPEWFLAATMLLCSLVSLSIGSSCDQIPERNMARLREMGREGLIAQFPPLADYWPKDSKAGKE